MIEWFISIIGVGDSRLKYWCIIEYIELDYRKKINHKQMVLYNKILHSLFVIDS